MKSSKFKSIMIVIALALLFVLVGGLIAAWATSTTPKDLIKDKPSVETPIDPPAQNSSPLLSGTLIDISASAEGQHLYINKADKVLSEAETYIKDNNMNYALFFSRNKLEENVTFEEAFTEDNIAFALYSLSNDEACSMIFMLYDESTFKLYDFSTKEFGSNVENTQFVTVESDGRIVFSDVFIEQTGIQEVYVYTIMSLFPEGYVFEGDFDVKQAWSEDMINKLFAFAPFEK